MSNSKEVCAADADAWSEKVSLKPLSVENLIKDINCADLLTNQSVLKAHQAIKQVMRDLKKTLAKKIDPDMKIDTENAYDSISIELEINNNDKNINLKFFKHLTENFIHSLTQSGVSIKVYGGYMYTAVPMTATVFFDFGEWLVTVGAEGMNTRLLWINCILSVLFYDLICALKKEKQIVHEMEAPKQEITDTLPEIEVTKVAENTIITQEVDDSTNANVEPGNSLQEAATTEQLSNLSPIAERFVRVFDVSQTLNITDNPNILKFELDIPNGLYKYFDSTIVSAVRSFTLIKTDVDILIKVNANQAQCGRYIVSSYPCRSQVRSGPVSSMSVFDNVYRMLQRDHAIVDVSKSNDVHLTIKYENLRPWLPVQTDEVGTVTGGSFATVVMRCLSPLRIADSGSSVCPYQVFARLRNTVLAGMRYPVSAAPDSSQEGVIVHEMRSIPPYKTPSALDDGLSNVVSAVKSIPVFGKIFGVSSNIMSNVALSMARLLSLNTDKIKEFESRLNYIGMMNKDRPIDISHPSPLLPMPVHSYAYGRTPYASKKLRLEPEATVPHFPDHLTVGDTQSILELARIPGFHTRFTLSDTQKQGDLLVELPAIPFDPRYTNQYPIVNPNVVQLPPVAYFFQMFNFYSGSIVYEFVPVKTPSHNFSLQVGFVPFNGNRGEVSEVQLQSCRWKVLDFRASEVGQFTVPWLSNNVMRATPYTQPGYFSSDSDLVTGGLSEMRNVFKSMKDPGKIVVRLVNELNPTPIVSPTIEILVFVKAHPNLRFLSPTSLKAIPFYRNDLPRYTRHFTENGRGGEIVPTYYVGNYATQSVKYEMSSEVQDGDEQTMYGDSLRDAPGPQIQTLERHDNILDICRRFYFQGTITGLFSRKQGETLTNEFPPYAVIPITPHTIQLSSGFGVMNERSFPIQTPRDAIVSCFRWMRGSLNIVIHSLTNIPLEVTYWPANDYPYLNTRYGTDVPDAPFTSTNTIPIFSVPGSVGLPTEVLEPRLNPILTIEVPMYNVNNYIDLQACMATRNATITQAEYDEKRNNINDLTANYLGNLVIRGLNGQRITPDEMSANNFKVRYLTAFGDDCVLQHFIGVPPVRLQSPCMHFGMVGGTTTFKNRTKTRQEIQTDLIAAGIESNPGPVVGFFQNSGLSIEKAFTSTKSLMTELRALLSTPRNISNQIEEIKLKGSGFVEQIQTVLAAYTEGIDLLELGALAFSIASVLGKNPNIYALLSVICQILKITGVFHATAISNCISRLSMIFQTDSLKPSHEMQNDTIASMASVFSSIILETYFAYSSVDKSQIGVDESYVKSIFINTFKNFNVMRSGALCILMNRLCSAVKVLWSTTRKWIRGLEKHDILTDDPNFIQGFMVDYEFFMDERNLSGQSLIQRHRDRFWTTVLTAYYLKGVLATVDKKYINLTLATAVKDIISKANILKSYMTAPPVRYEPFTLWFWGEPGTGKTTIMQSITTDMAKNIGIRCAGDPIYVRSPHSQWWNGYDNQPIVMIDDANGVNDPQILGRCISEFQAMKSSAKMRIEMPRLEEKNSEMTSVILGICSNISEWRSSMIVDRDAFRRRRDMVVHVTWSSVAEDWFRMNPKIMKVASNLPKEMLGNNRHLNFNIASNPLVSDTVGIKYDWPAFQEKLFKVHKKYNSDEIDKMTIRYEKSLELSQHLGEKIMDRTTLRAALLSVVMGCESTEVMAETMKRQLYELKSVSPTRFNELPKHTRNILERMTETSISHEAPGLGHYSDLVRVNPIMSDWFRNTLFPAFEVGNTAYISLMREFRPWNYEEQRTFEMDLIITPCSGCRENYGLRASVSYICANSVEDSQHWICHQCKPNFDRGHSQNCPVCRGDSLVAISIAQNEWRFHSKVAHFVSTAAGYIKRPLVSTLEILWQNSMIIAYLGFLGTLTYLVVSRNRQAVAENQLYQDEAEEFIMQYGVIPDSYSIINGKCYFLHNRTVFVKNDDNQFQTLNDSSIVLEAPGKKGKGKEKEEVARALAEGKPVELQEVNELFSSDSDEPTTSGYLSPIEHEFDFRAVLPMVDCKLEHGNFNLTQNIRNKRHCTIYCDETSFIVNLKNSTGEYESVQIPFEYCSSPNCKFNSEVSYIFDRFMEQRIPIWRIRLIKGQPVFDEDLEEIPSGLKNYFLNLFKNDVPIKKTWYQQMVIYQKDLLQVLKGRLLSWFNNIYEQLCEKWHYLISIVALSYALYHGVKYYYSEEEGVTLEPIHESGSWPTNTGKGKHSVAPNTRMYVKNPSPSYEMKMTLRNKPPENISTVCEVLYKNKFTIMCAGMKVQGFVITNNIGIFPRHAYCFLSKLQDEGEPILLQLKEGSEILIKQRLGLHVIEDNVKGEYVLLQHKQLTGRDIRHHIYTTIQDTVTYPPYAYGLDLQTGEIVPVQIVSVDQKNEEEAQEITTQWKVKDKSYSYTSKMIEYLTCTNFRGEGKCGSPIVNPDGKIISIHFAGHQVGGTSYGYSAPVFREYFNIHHLGQPQEIIHEMNGLENLRYYSHYPNPPFHTDKTKLRPSAIADKAWESQTFPCIQSNKDPRYKFDSTPLMDGASTIGVKTNNPDPIILKAALRAVSNEMLKHMPTPSMPAPVSIHEAVTAEFHRYVEPMKLNTSAGLPYIADFPNKKLKSDYIDHTVYRDNRHKVTLDPIFKAKYISQFNGRLKGVSPREPFWAHLKDERRKVEKLTSFGGTRVFSVAPLELVLTCRRALLPVMDAFHSNPIQLHHAIGLSPDSIQWTEMIENMRAKSQFIIQLDFSKFSDSMPWPFVEAAFQVISDYYLNYNLLTDELSKMLSTLCDDITQSLVCVGSEVYELRNGTLQGHPITALINSLVNIIEQTYVWIKTTNYTGSEFFTRCGLIVMGDDVVISVPKRFLKVYNGQTIAAEFGKMNIVVTDETKNKDAIQKFQPIERFDFLSRSYSLHPFRQLYLAPSDSTSIFDTALWIKSKDGPFGEATLENVEQSLMNAFGHGPCIYEMYRSTLEFLTKNSFRSWFELDYIFYGDAGFDYDSCISSSVGFSSGSKPKVLDMFIKVEKFPSSNYENQFWNPDFLNSITLDKGQAKPYMYKCNCRYDCESELLKRIKSVEIKNGVSRKIFLPFLTQEEGTKILGANLNATKQFINEVDTNRYAASAISTGPLSISS